MTLPSPFSKSTKLTSSGALSTTDLKRVTLKQVNPSKFASAKRSSGATLKANWALLTYWDKHGPSEMNRIRKILQMTGPAANRAAWSALPNNERAECVKSPNIDAVPVKSSEISRPQQ